MEHLDFSMTLVEILTMNTQEFAICQIGDFQHQLQVFGYV